MNVLGKIFVSGKYGRVRLSLIIVNQIPFLAIMYAERNKFYSIVALTARIHDHNTLRRANPWDHRILRGSIQNCKSLDRYAMI